ncbi:Hypothetical protein NTJ_01978 [Nesidiocoris tenuis]|uniref:Uncharacterized protein n=1 Tax=Nesidiocoris tenuis TaxID=355587 RepID=A0ABN7AA31_9HEMI|nr:Hypothetical protein NTJ_01978 [Nesidiocoris tenuis]
MDGRGLFTNPHSNVVTGRAGEGETASYWSKRRWQAQAPRQRLTFKTQLAALLTVDRRFEKKKGLCCPEYSGVACSNQKEPYHPALLFTNIWLQI